MPGIGSWPDFWPMILFYVGTPILVYFLYRISNWKIELTVMVSGVVLTLFSGLFQRSGPSGYGVGWFTWIGFPFPWFIIYTRSSNVYNHFNFLAFMGNFVIYSFLCLAFSAAIVAHKAYEKQN